MFGRADSQTLGSIEWIVELCSLFDPSLMFSCWAFGVRFPVTQVCYR